MDFVALGLNSGSSDARSSMPAEIVQHLQILIRGLALHAIEGDSEDLRTLQRSLSELADSLNAESSADDLLVAIGKTLRALEEHNRRAAVVFTGQVNELREMLSTMTATLMFVTSSSEKSVKQFGVIEAKLHRATSLEDTRQLKLYLAECLTLVRSESLRLQAETRAQVDTLKGDVDRLSSRLKTASTGDSQDSVTGLPGRFLAEEAITSKITSGKDFVAALFMLDRLPSINGRFGRVVGDDILLSGAQLLAQRLKGTTLYRWSGPAFAAVFDPSVNVVQAEGRATQAAAMRLEKNIEIGQRTVMLVVTCSCHLQRISAKFTPETVFRNMDAFMVERGAVATPA